MVHDPQYPEPLKGRNAIARDLAEFFRAFPDLRMELKQSLVVEDCYAMEYALTGTHKGPLVRPSGTIPASNRRIEVGGSAIARIGDEGRVPRPAATRRSNMRAASCATLCGGHCFSPVATLGRVLCCAFGPPPCIGGHRMAAWGVFFRKVDQNPAARSLQDAVLPHRIEPCKE